MVNRRQFNNQFSNKRKIIRERKRARINNKKIFLGYEKKEDSNVNPKLKKRIKKEERRLKRNEQILAAAGVKAEEVKNLLSKKIIKRRDKRRKRYIKSEKNEMEIEK